MKKKRIKSLENMSDPTVRFGECEDCHLKASLTMDKLCEDCSDERNFADAGGYED